MGLKQENLQHYDIKTLGKSLKLTSIDVIKTSQVDIESHWFRSTGPADLYFWRTEKKIVKQQVSLFGQVVEWNEYDGVKTGFVNEDTGGESSEVINFDEQVNALVVEQVIELLKNATQIEEQTTQELIDHYQFYNRLPFLNPIFRIKCLYRKLFKK